MSRRIFTGVTGAIAMAFAVATAGCVTGCAVPNDKVPVTSCNPPKGYVKAGLAGKTGKGQFYFCMKTGKQCKIIIKYKDTKATTNRQVVKTLNREGFATIPKDAKSWKSSDCGDIYKSDLVVE
jgi:hypothetical protein